VRVKSFFDGNENIDTGDKRTWWWDESSASQRFSVTHDQPSASSQTVNNLFRATSSACLWTLILAVAHLLSAVQARAADTHESLGYHSIQVDSDSNILPWCNQDPGTSYDYVVGLVWNFWNNMRTGPNGLVYYLQHAVWVSSDEDARPIAGDQLAMALSSWSQLYSWTGDEGVKVNMVYLADYYLAHSLSSSNAIWPNLPYPCNLTLDSGIYDGDMVAGVAVLQPDKAASFGAELLTLHKMTGAQKYLGAARAIADTLAANVVAGDDSDSPWPFRVNAEDNTVVSPYTVNWTGALRLFGDLIRLNVGQTNAYAAAKATTIAWLKQYPLQTYQWGPFFEDVGDYSDTEINGDTLAWYILENPDWGPTWTNDARAILDSTEEQFGNTDWAEYGVLALNEQTAYPVPGNSHSSRHWSVELLYAAKTGDASRKALALRGLNWATYFVDVDGKSMYPDGDIWLTDGYGDYVRHFLRAMAAAPEIVPTNRHHLLQYSSVVTTIACSNGLGSSSVVYQTYETNSTELLRLATAPLQVLAGGVALPRLSSPADLNYQQGYCFEAPGDAAGVLRIRHDNSGSVTVECQPIPGAVTPQGAVTLGSTAEGVTSDIIGADSVNAFKSQAATNMVLTQMWLKLATPGSGKLKLGIYSDNEGQPGSLLRGTIERSALGIGWQAFDLTAPLPLAGGSNYWLACWTDDDSYSAWAVPAAGACSFAPADYGATWPDPFPDDVDQSDFRYSLYGSGWYPSGFSILTLTREGNDLLLVWQTTGGQTNIVQAATSLVGSSNAFSDISPPLIIPGAGNVLASYRDSGGATNASRFYRVRLD
jgi:hypothetical protein